MMKCLWLSSLAMVILIPLSTAGQQPQSTPGAGASAALKYFTDVELINQEGTPVRLYSDLLKGKVVIINSFYATEHPACTAMFRNLAKVQEALGNHVGKDVFLISVTVDPANDTPAKLKTFAHQFKAGPGWSFVTGSSDHVKLALQKLGMSVADKDHHLMVLIIANEPTGLWKKAVAMGKPEEITQIVLDTLSDR